MTLVFVSLHSAICCSGASLADRRCCRMEELIYEFKVFLVGSDPVVWRRIHIKGVQTMEELKAAVYASMDWTPELIEGDLEWCSLGLHDLPPGKLIRDCFSPHQDEVFYRIRNFSGHWTHRVRFLKRIKYVRRQPAKSYPLCVSGRRTRPPERAPLSMDEFNDVRWALSNPTDERFEFWRNRLRSWLPEDRRCVEPDDRLLEPFELCSHSTEE